MRLPGFCIRAMNAVKGFAERKNDKALSSFFRLPLVGRTRADLMTTVETSSLFKDGSTVCPTGEVDFSVPQTESEVIEQELEWEIITQVNIQDNFWDDKKFLDSQLPKGEFE